jgi:hypothetical protein
MEPNFIRIGTGCREDILHVWAPQVLLVLTKIMHPTRRRMGPPFRLLLLHTRIIESTFFILYRGSKILRVLTKSWSRILFGSAHKVVAHCSKSYQYSFWVSAHLQVLLVLTKSNASDTTGGGWAPSDCCSYTQE